MKLNKDGVSQVIDNQSIRHDWTVEGALELMQRPFNDLLHQAHSIHRRHADPNHMQLSTLLNIKSGGCPEDCSYCPQSIRHDNAQANEPLLDLDAVLAAASAAKKKGASRFCMGAAWRRPRPAQLEQVITMIKAVKALGMETCVTLGMLDETQAWQLKAAGLDYYNHNLDTSPEYYPNIITTRDYQDRLDTLRHVRDAEINICCGGIIGLGEDQGDRCALLVILANMPTQPESVPINVLVQVEGTPLYGTARPEGLDIVRMVATARIMMPATCLRLSAGRQQMSEELQALCFYAGANSVFYDDHLLTTDNPTVAEDKALFEKLGICTHPPVMKTDAMVNTGGGTHD